MKLPIRSGTQRRHLQDLACVSPKQTRVDLRPIYAGLEATRESAHRVLVQRNRTSRSGRAWIILVEYCEPPIDSVSKHKLCEASGLLDVRGFAPFRPASA